MIAIRASCNQEQLGQIITQLPATPTTHTTMHLTTGTDKTINRKLQCLLCLIIVQFIITIVTDIAVEGDIVAMGQIRAEDIVRSLDIQDMAVERGMVMAFVASLAEETSETIEEPTCSEYKPNKYSTDYVYYFTD